MSSPRTTIAGLLGIIAAVFSAASAMMDNDPKTNPDWIAVGSAVTMGVGLMSARDNKTTSKDAGAVDKPPA